jgi:hypothetical protein
MNVIFGSGVVGLLAKFILGPSWTIVPFYKSRFYSFNPSLDDNFIIRDDQIDDVIKEITHEIKPTIYEYKRAWSIGGQILTSWNSAICDDWLYKIFGDKVPSQSSVYNKDRMLFGVYGIRVNDLYARLMNLFIDELKAEYAKGQVQSVGDHYFVRNNTKLEFDRAINTVPLNHISKLCGKDLQLPNKHIHYWHVRTDELDFEGNNQLLVADNLFGFYKVTNIAPGRYMFYCHENIDNPGVYLMGFMRKFDIIDGTSISEAMPLGSMPNLNWLENIGIYSVGSYAQWDWCADVGSNILKIVRYANRGGSASKFSYRL